MATTNRDRSQAYFDSISIALGRLVPETEVSAQDGGWLAPLRFLEIRLIQCRSSCRFRDWNIPRWRSVSLGERVSPCVRRGRGMVSPGDVVKAA